MKFSAKKILIVDMKFHQEMNRDMKLHQHKC